MLTAPNSYTSLGSLAALLGVSAQAVRRAAERAEVQPAIDFDGIPYFDEAGAVAVRGEIDGTGHDGRQLGAPQRPDLQS
jgi:hypothetical protein